MYVAVRKQSVGVESLAGGKWVNKAGTRDMGQRTQNTNAQSNVCRNVISCLHPIKPNR